MHYVHKEHNSKLDSNKQGRKHPPISLGSKHKIDYVYKPKINAEVEYSSLSKLGFYKKSLPLPKYPVCNTLRALFSSFPLLPQVIHH